MKDVSDKYRRHHRLVRCILYEGEKRISMRQFIKIATLMIAILTIFVLGGCAGKNATPSTLAKDSATPAPTIIVEPSPSPAITLPASYYSTTDEIPPETEMAIFNFTDDDTLAYNTEFTGSTSADLDGDGKADTVQLLPGTLNENSSADDGIKLYDSIIVKINNCTITVNAPKGETILESFTREGQIDGYIMDIDKNDGKKEICVDDSDENFPVSCLLTYDGQNIKELSWLEDIISANGTGYIRAYAWIDAGKLAQEDGIGIQRLLKLSADRSKWEDVKVKYYRTASTYLPPIDEYTPAATSQWDQNLAKAPGGKEEVPVKAGTEVFLGFYDAMGWIQVIQRDGTILGWLDCKKVDWDKYTDYVYAPDLG